MPYGIPWDDSVAECHCVSCNILTRGHGAYCCYCGAKQPDIEEAEKQGLIKYPLANARFSNDINEINAFLREHQGHSVRLWGYGVSHAELALRLVYSVGPKGSEEYSDQRNLIICMTETDLIQAPTGSWDSSIIIQEKGVYKDSSGWLDLYGLVDEPANVKITFGGIHCYFNADAKLC